MRQYQSLSDVYGPGDTEIWYLNYNKNIDPYFDTFNSEQINKTHILLGTTSLKNLDDIFRSMQGEIWSPNGEANSLIETKNLEHTSMSVGDVVKLNGEYFQCKPIGWNKI